MPAHRKNIQRLLDTPRTGLMQIPIEQGPWVLDALWGNFMATGDEAPVVRIMSVRLWANTKGDASRVLIGSAAKWSLASNAVQHYPVLAACKKQLAVQPEQVRAILQEIIASTEKKRDQNLIP